MTMQNPSDLDGQPLDLLIKILRMTESENDNIALSAVRKANAHLAKMGTSWDPLLRGKVKIIADPFASIDIPKNMANPNNNQPFTPPPPAPPAPQWSPPWPSPSPQAAAGFRRRKTPTATTTTFNTPRPTPPFVPSGPPKRTIVNKFESVCQKCGNRVLVGEGLAMGYEKPDGSYFWVTEHTLGTCPPTRRHGGATGPDQFQV